MKVVKVAKGVKGKVFQVFQNIPGSQLLSDFQKFFYIITCEFRVHRAGSQLKTLENTFKTCGTATTTFCMGVEQSIGKAILHFMAEVRGGKSQTIYTSDFFGTHKFTPKVRDSRQIQCYSKYAIRDKSNTKKV